MPVGLSGCKEHSPGLLREGMGDSGRLQPWRGEDPFAWSAPASFSSPLLKIWSSGQIPDRTRWIEQPVSNYPHRQGPSSRPPHGLPASQGWALLAQGPPSSPFRGL